MSAVRVRPVRVHVLPRRLREGRVHHVVPVLPGDHRPDLQERRRRGQLPEQGPVQHGGQHGQREAVRVRQHVQRGARHPRGRDHIRHHHRHIRRTQGGTQQGHGVDREQVHDMRQEQGLDREGRGQEQQCGRGREGVRLTQETETQHVRLRVLPGVSAGETGVGVHRAGEFRQRKVQ